MYIIILCSFLIWMHNHMDTLKKKAHMVIRMVRIDSVHNLASSLNLEKLTASIVADIVALRNMDCILAEGNE